MENEPNKENNKFVSEISTEGHELEVYGDGLTSADAKVPGWLKWTYIILPIWGIIVWYIYWNGSVGWLDRGSWAELQEAANTTFPFKADDE
jgi:hypothetical protein